MSELGWKEAIIAVLKKRAEPMHYADITQEIATDKLRENFGATPASTVNSIICISLQKDGDKSPFIKAGRGVYSLRLSKATTASRTTVVVPETEKAETGFINAFGMFWQRDKVLWTTTPKLLGQQQPGSEPVNFGSQKGVYLLHDGSRVVYVGRTTDQPLGSRLKQHTIDRLNGRWDRFSWFGIFAVKDDGGLTAGPPDTFSVENLIATMEALLIEGLEPPQNRKRGDDFSAVEFLQVTDPDILKSQSYDLIEKLKKKL